MSVLLRGGWCITRGVYQGRLRIKFVYLFFLIPLGILMRIFLLPRLQMNLDIQDFTWALIFTGLIASLIAYQNRGGSVSWLALLKPVGDFSYTLYVTHYPIIIFISG